MLSSNFNEAISEIKWDYEPKLTEQKSIGIVQFSGDIIFDIAKHCNCEFSKIENRYIIAGWNYSVSYTIHGNCSGLTFNTKQQVLDYLQKQFDLTSQYNELIGKRNTLQKRIKPLQQKWFTYADKIHDLAKIK